MQKCVVYKLYWAVYFEIIAFILNFTDNTESFYV